MCLPSAFLGLITLMFAVNEAKSSLANATNNHSLPVALCERTPINHCNCHCNVNQNSGIDEAVKALERKLEHLIALVNETFIAGKRPNPTPASLVSSCKEQYEKDNSSKSQVYELMFGSQKASVYCHMGNFGCGDGGWTLAMKIDGTKKTFHFDSRLWSDRHAYNLLGGETGFDMQETKLPTYWNTPFSKICLGMRIGHQINFLFINKSANSLFSLIADGNYRATSLGRNKWKTLVGSEASLQTSCSQEGFNAASRSKSHSKARIGIIANKGKSCNSCHSRIGLGTGGHPDDSNSCGNEAERTGDNGEKHIKAMGYILVQ